MPRIDVVFLDWGNTLMVDQPGQVGPMMSWPTVSEVPGAREALRVLRPRYRLIVATNADASGAPEVLAALRRVGMDELVDEVVSSRDVGAVKPSRTFFAAALRVAFGEAPTPAGAVMVGDSWENDVEGALAAGLRAVWLNPSGASAPPDRTTPDAVIGAMKELPAVLRRLDTPSS